MSDDRKLRVNGLANLASLMVRNPDVLKQAATPVKPPKESRDAICQRTIGNLQGLTLNQHQGVMRRIVEAAVREAYNAGHAAALVQNGAVEDALSQQNEARTRYTLPTAVAAIMEHIGMDELVLDLDAVASVFKRNRIEFKVVDADEGNPQYAHYKMFALIDEAGGTPQ
jgi:hypothetical protein